MATSRPRITAKKSRHFGEILAGGKHHSSARLQIPPGQHGPMKAAKKDKQTDYGRQLMQKQKARLLFGVTEKQFRSYVDKALASKGNTTTGLYRFLEKRLDNAVYRVGMVQTRAAGRQMVSHGLVLVNGKRLNIPSFQLSVGDVITLRPKVLKSKMMDHIRARLPQSHVPSWLSLVGDSEIKVVADPQNDDFDKSFDAGQIIEFYSR